MRSSAKLRKRKDRPSSPLRFDSPDPDPAGNGVPTLAGPSKKPRLTSQTDEQPVDNGTGGPSSISCMEAEVSAGATSARDDAAVEHAYDPLTAPECARPPNARVYKSSYARKRAAKTVETAATITEPEVPRHTRVRAATAGPSQVRDPPPKEQGKKKSRK
ncbi:hypothetical protein EWM64_g9821 [Hericium alpestre]|uniref:Uncharacterized protein n=1 Tax=Hericium alpestre TaxID=135208 RepID=A0A4Y9ZK07_9AGAM|nr:hypothetical protein EWM64_g9821 [Hericium alpestre]